VLNNKVNTKNNPHYSNDKSSGGYTLIELIIAIGVFTLGIMGVLGLAVSNYHDSQDNVDRVIAINLAREGLELIKNVRDSNWLRIDGNQLCGFSPCTWDSGFDNVSDYMVMAYNDSDGWPNFLIDCNQSIESCVNGYITSNAGVKLYINGFGNYDHDNTGNSTKFSRVIKISKICLIAGGSINEGGDPHNFEYAVDMDTDCGVSETHIGFNLISHVQWEDNGTQTAEISSSIYNWKR